MKKILLGMMPLMALLLLGSCTGEQRSDGVCHIHGTIPADYNGKRIFLVPLTGPATAANVDSVVVENGRFEFQSDTMMMGKILLDYHFRYGVQTLLVVVEPGDVTVSIDSVSHGGGTLQNDSLERWKRVTEVHNRELASLRRSGMSAEADSIHLRYKKYTRRLADNLPEGLLRDFLASLYPLTYKKKMPDGRVVTIDSDTNEEVK